MSTIQGSLLTLSLAMFAGCVHAVPTELTNARIAYSNASEGPAAELVPADLHIAQQALAVAEQAFVDDPRSYHTLDLAYVAQRTSQKADAMGRLAVQQEKTETANADFTTTQTAMMKDTRAELQASKASGAETKVALAGSEAALAGSEAALAGSETARLAADKRTLAALAALASMKEEERGLVITLSGSVLFRSDEASLLPEAETRLNQVATALLETKERKLVIEGHTDADGEAPYNMDLSQRRADAVRHYLEGRGYNPELITSNGIGEARPIADNGTPEGKANNRRVEIVVSH